MLAPLGVPGRVLQVLSLEVCDLLDGVHPEYPGADWIPNCSVPVPLRSLNSLRQEMTGENCWRLFMVHRMVSLTIQ